MHIPFVDLKSQYQNIKEEIDNAVKSVIDETAFIGGKYVKEFEEHFAALYGVNNCISTANGTDSLYIVLKMLGIGSGDEVITAANSWISSSETITQTGAKPVFLDVDKDYYSLDEKLLEAKINKNTKAIIPVHLHGQMCKMDAIMDVAKKHNIPVIEDCAQAHFSELKTTRAGLFGVAGSFSFYPGKNLGAYGDAGCIITNDDDLAEKCRMYARHGALKKHEHQMEGINSRMDGMQAAILNSKLPYILDWTGARVSNAHLYNRYLKDIPQIIVPKVRPDTKHTFHLYVIQCENREELVNHLRKNNIDTAIHYPTPLPFLPAYKYLNCLPTDFPIAASQQKKILSLPMYPELTEDMISYIANCIKDFYQKR